MRFAATLTRNALSVRAITAHATAAIAVGVAGLTPTTAAAQSGLLDGISPGFTPFSYVREAAPGDIVRFDLLRQASALPNISGDAIRILKQPSCGSFDVDRARGVVTLSIPRSCDERQAALYCLEIDGECLPGELVVDLTRPVAADESGVETAALSGSIVIDAAANVGDAAPSASDAPTSEDTAALNADGQNDVSGATSGDALASVAASAGGVERAARAPANCAVTTAQISTHRRRAALNIVEIDYPCRARTEFVIAYQGLRFTGALDSSGKAEVLIPALESRAPATLEFAGGERARVEIAARDWDRIARMALVWRDAVDLDLIAYEPGNQANGFAIVKVSAATPGALTREARRQGGGFLLDFSAAIENGNLEVYTYYLPRRDTSLTLPMAISYVSRGAVAAPPYCGEGALASVEYQISTNVRGAVDRLNARRFQSVPCGAPIAPDALENIRAAPDLIVR